MLGFISAHYKCNSQTHYNKLDLLRLSDYFLLGQAVLQKEGVRQRRSFYYEAETCLFRALLLTA
ncbi:hypothetical protein DJ90_6395 [Paenibacillus macerans]|uniref:Uncharacterized protein n=1 Tax=Paenibacillus macerans TaxID=44252 RepID=A0A090ZLZ0_PAEMA|nr:hypothetical protein DJ90_6395 [Paenibacillus macerans]